MTQEQYIPDYPIHGQIVYGNLEYAIWVHNDVLEKLQDMPELQQRLSIILQQLASHGRTSRVKGSSDGVNRGWRRSPLGGNGGMQYYLWWAVEGTRPLPANQWSGRRNARTIAVRSVRHHDNHSPIHVDKLRDYSPFSQTDILGGKDSFIQEPWTPQQRNFIESDNPVRIVHGLPGSGKTTVLQRAVESRTDNEVIYLTWSQNLSDYARQRFNSFVPSGVRVYALDFATFLGEICGHDVVRQPLETGREKLISLLTEARIYDNALGPWAAYKREFHDTLRAGFFGAAVPGAAWLPCDPLRRPTDGEYRTRNSNGEHTGTFVKRIVDWLQGKATPNRALLDMVKKIGNDDRWRDVFPELVAAVQAIEHLRNDELPASFSGCDRIVVDEVQDLTLLEFAVVVELCNAIARKSAKLPYLLVAGDDGQTVRPTGFDWGPVKDLLSERLGNPQDFPLEENLRSPANIADVVSRVSSYYSTLGKNQRPTKQLHYTNDSQIEAQLFHVAISDTSDAGWLLDQLSQKEYLSIVAPDDNIPQWVPEDLRSLVLTPAAAKGLEYQSVCVLAPGRMLKQFSEAINDANGSSPLEIQARRTAIDQFRVAISRAAESLTFIDVSDDDAEMRLSRELLQDFESYEPAALIEYLSDADITPEERIMVRIREAEEQIENAPSYAWTRICQAVELLNSPGFPASELESLCTETRYTLLSVSCRLLTNGFPPNLERSDIVEKSEDILETLQNDVARDGFHTLERLTSEPATPPFPLLNAVLALGNNHQWLSGALPPFYQTIRQSIERYATVPAEAVHYSGDVESWLRTTGYADSIAPKARELRCKAAAALLDNNDIATIEGIELVLRKVKPEEPSLTGRLREKQERYEDAAQAFDRAGLPDDTRRNWRMAGRWERAIPLTKDHDELADLQWLADLEQLIRRRPVGQGGRLTDLELQRLIRIASPLSKPES